MIQGTTTRVRTFHSLLIHTYSIDDICPSMAFILETAIGDANQITYETLVCSADLTEGTQNQLIFHSVLNILLSTTAFVGNNTLILVALHKESSLHPPSKLLFRCVTTTDLRVAIIIEPLTGTYWMSVVMVNEQWSVCRYSSSLPHLS